MAVIVGFFKIILVSSTFIDFSFMGSHFVVKYGSTMIIGVAFLEDFTRNVPYRDK